MTEQQDAFPETPPIEVDMTDPGDILHMGEVHGLNRALEALQAVPDGRRAPGFAYALALLQVQAAEAMARRCARNLILVSKAGIDIASIANVSARGHTLICTPYPPGEGD